MRCVLCGRLTADSPGPGAPCEVCRGALVAVKEVTYANAAARWTALADSYGRRPPTDIVGYPMAIIALLSDAQWVFLDDEQGGNDRINAAKMMLSRMIEAARNAEREAARVATACIDGGAENADGPNLIGKDRVGNSISGPVCSDRVACAHRRDHGAAAYAEAVQRGIDHGAEANAIRNAGPSAVDACNGCSAVDLPINADGYCAHCVGGQIEANAGDPGALAAILRLR